ASSRSPSESACSKWVKTPRTSKPNQKPRRLGSKRTPLGSPQSSLHRRRRPKSRRGASRLVPMHPWRERPTHWPHPRENHGPQEEAVGAAAGAPRTARAVARKRRKSGGSPKPRRADLESERRKRLRPGRWPCYYGRLSEETDLTDGGTFTTGRSDE